MNEVRLIEGRLNEGRERGGGIDAEKETYSWNETEGEETGTNRERS